MSKEPQPRVAMRRVALALWCGMLAQLALFFAMVLALTRPGPAFAPALAPDRVLGLAAPLGLGGIVLSRLLPARMRESSGRPETLGLVRFLVCWGVCDAAAVVPLVAYLLTRDVRLLAVFGAAALALALYYPSPDRWAKLAAPEEGAGPPTRMVR